MRRRALLLAPGGALCFGAGAWRLQQLERHEAEHDAGGGGRRHQREPPLDELPHRLAEAADQANVICFLASSDADFVTGLTIDVTGGV